MYKSNGNQGLFEQQFSQEHLTKMGDPLSSIRKAIDFAMFRKLLEASLRNKDKKSKVGAKPFAPVMLFKILMLQRYYGLGDHQTEYQIVDRSSFKDFLGLSSGDKVPDEKTI
jgi:IS5 family transposase